MEEKIKAEKPDAEKCPVDVLVSEMRGLEIDHTPAGYPAVQMCEISALCDNLEKYRAALINIRDWRFLIPANVRGVALEALES